MPTDVTMVSDWVFRHNLNALLEILSALARYDYGADDWAAVETGLAQTDAEGNAWLTYPLCGQAQFDVDLARDLGTDVVLLKIGVPRDAVPRVETAILIAQSYRLAPA